MGNESVDGRSPQINVYNLTAGTLRFNLMIDSNGGGDMPANPNIEYTSPPSTICCIQGPSSVIQCPSTCQSYDDGSVNSVVLYNLRSYTGSTDPEGTYDSTFGDGKKNGPLEFSLDYSNTSSAGGDDIRDGSNTSAVVSIYVGTIDDNFETNYTTTYSHPYEDNIFYFISQDIPYYSGSGTLDNSVWSDGPAKYVQGGREMLNSVPSSDMTYFVGLPNYGGNPFTRDDKSGKNDYSITGSSPYTPVISSPINSSGINSSDMTTINSFLTSITISTS